MSEKLYLAVDLGASGGRVLLGAFNGEHITVEEIYRFQNGAIEMAGTLYWDLPALWQHLLNGLRTAHEKAAGRHVTSVGVDTWGVDFTFLDRNGQMLGMPVMYRDSRTDGMPEDAFSIMSREEIYALTGVQFMQFNTLYQLTAMRRANSPLLDTADRFLMIPDLFHWLLSGVAVNEFTNVTTTQVFSPVLGTWAYDLLKKFQIPAHMFREITPPGTCLGSLRDNVVRYTGFSNLKVVLPGTHDTASAVMAVPAQINASGGRSPDWAYLSLGTWALMGIESPVPVISPETLSLNITNEGGVENTYRLLKNISGMWILQECKRLWNQRGFNWDWDTLMLMAQNSPSGKCFINPEASIFFAPDNMPDAICTYCRNTSQYIPRTEGEILRCALESIACRFQDVFLELQKINRRPLNRIHVIGGGTKNHFLCQIIANMLRCPVTAGPAEATGIGNIMMQAMADGCVKDLAEARDVIRRSFPLKEYTPQEHSRCYEDEKRL